MEVCVGVTGAIIYACAKTASLETSARCVSGFALPHKSVSLTLWANSQKPFWNAHEPYCTKCLSLSPPSGWPMCTETLWKPWHLQEWQERELQLCLQSRTHGQRLRERSVGVIGVLLNQSFVIPYSVAHPLIIAKTTFFNYSMYGLDMWGCHCSQTCCLPLVSTCSVWRRTRWSCAGMSRSPPKAWSADSLSPTLPWAGPIAKQTTWTSSSPPTSCEAWCPVCCTTSPPSPSKATTWASPPRH